MSDNEIKVYPDGTTKILHTNAQTLKLSAPLKTKDGKPWKGNPKGIVMTYDDPQHGPQTMQCHGARFSGDALKVPANKDILDGCKELLPLVKEYMMDDDAEEPPKVTITCIKKDGYWDYTNVQVGHIGNAGIFREGEDTNKPSGNGGYNPSGAIIGKIENWALEVTIANKTAKSKVTLESVLETLEGFDAELIKQINEVATTKYEEAYSGGSKSTAKSDPEPAEEEDLPEDDDDDDNIPY